jgi:hypothetical protein
VKTGQPIQVNAVLKTIVIGCSRAIKHRLA